jgi:ribonuclease P protein component
VTVTYAQVGTAPVPRVAYAVGRRAGNAVTRNRARRRLRAAVGAIAELAPGAYLVAAGPQVASMPYDELRKEVAQAMTSASGARS